jgi:hypothetical protein
MAASPMASFPFINTFAMVLLHLSPLGVRFFGFFDGYGHIRAHDAAHGAVDAIVRTRLKCWIVAFRIHIGRNFQNIFWTYGDAQAAAFAAVLFDVVLIRHEYLLLIAMEPCSIGNAAMPCLGTTGMPVVGRVLRQGGRDALLAD